MSLETIERKFNVPSPARLSLGNIRGSIQVLPGAAGEISISAVKDTASGDSERTEIRIEQAQDGSVKVETRSAEGVLNLFRLRPCKVEYTARVPQDCRLHLSGVSCTISVQELQGEFHINTVSGSVEARELFGPVKVNTVSGGFSADQIAGSLEFDAVSGGVTLLNSRLGSVKGKTVSGGIRIETPLAEGPYNFNSVSGELTLVVPDGTSCTAELTSLSGQIHTGNLPVTSRIKSNGKRLVEIRGGGPQVHLNSVSGGIHITTSGNISSESAPEPPAAEEQAPSHVQEILDQIERGEISVDEGIAKIKSSG
ncbi:MAG: DUF4097 family beta strand repeat-containing protein [Omnitrophica WOR_2 bacterium]